MPVLGHRLLSMGRTGGMGAWELYHGRAMLLLLLLLLQLLLRLLLVLLLLPLLPTVVYILVYTSR